MFFKILGYPTRPFHRGRFRHSALLFGQLNAPFDVADGLQVLSQLAAVTGAQIRLQTVEIARDVIEDAALFPQSAEARSGVRGVAVSEKTLEHSPGVDFHG